jgi:DnaJ like chaperone protein
MSWLGKAIGGAFGFVMGGPIGAALGAAFGHQFDQQATPPPFGVSVGNGGRTEALQQCFLLGVFSVMGHLAKLDGRVSEAEIMTARKVMERMGLGEDLKLLAMKLFNEGKEDQFALSEVLDDFRRACRAYPPMLRFFIVVQVEMALADGPMSEHKALTLLMMCDRIGFSRYEYFGIKTRRETEQRFATMGDQSKRSKNRAGTGHEHYRRREADSLGVGKALDEAYAILKLPRGATEIEVKRAYRRLISRHHPDKLEGTGQGSRAVQEATEITQKIQKAFELISKSRGY